MTAPTMHHPESKSEPAPRIALFITYTMVNPIVGGAFFRALRLATELEVRGWQAVICNDGPILDDPKTVRAQQTMRFVQLDYREPALSPEVCCARFKALNPTVVIMGESPFETMRIFYEGARMIDRPFVVLDQFYRPGWIPDKEGVDLVLLYALRSFWPKQFHPGAPYALVPPFIEAVTPKSLLPVPASLGDLPWVTLVAYDDTVLKKGVALLGRLETAEIGAITVSGEPEEAARLLAATGLPNHRCVTLPLQSDANIFGLMGSSAVTLVSNGFLQIMEALAMACPVIALDRKPGIAMGPENIDPRFYPYVSIGQDETVQRDRVLEWLADAPIPASLAASLQSERGGTSCCAQLIEELVHRTQRSSWPARHLRRVLSTLRGVGLV